MTGGGNNEPRLPLDIQFINSETTCFSGSCRDPISNGTYWWDWARATEFNLSLANFDTSPHTVTQINMSLNTFGECGELLFFKNLSLSEEANLPITLLPLEYWQYYLTSPEDAYPSKFYIEVDGECVEVLVETFGYHDLYETTWPPHWTRLTYYNPNRKLSLWIPFSSPFLILLTFCVVILSRRLIVHSVKKRTD